VTTQPTPGALPGHDRVSTPWQVPWPDGCIARYWTVAGATVDLTGGGDRTYVRCTGCPYDMGGTWWSEDTAHERAQAHAESCRALPRPAVTQ
jgi:hypothetical protein